MSWLRCSCGHESLVSGSGEVLCPDCGQPVTVSAESSRFVDRAVESFRGKDWFRK